MTESLDTVYDALLMEHIRSARNYGFASSAAADTPGGHVVISNPLCGDVLELVLDWEGEHLRSARFSCECCGIAMGSTSLMTTLLPGQNRAGLRALAGYALALLRGLTDADDARNLALPSTVTHDNWRLLTEIARRLPARRTCASLGWQALLGGLDDHTQCTAHEIRP